MEIDEVMHRLAASAYRVIRALEDAHITIRDLNDSLPLLIALIMTRIPETQREIWLQTLVTASKGINELWESWGLKDEKDKTH